MYKFGNRSLGRLKGVNPQLIECAKRALAESIYDMTIPYLGGLRTPEQQKDCFDRGASKCDGYNKLSYHQAEAADNGYGNAVDIIPVDGGYDNTRALNYFARLMLLVWQEMLTDCEAEGVMIWGGTFGATGWDKPHFEIRL